MAGAGLPGGETVTGASNTTSPGSVTTKLLLRRAAAAHVRSMSLDSFERHVQPNLQLVRAGSLVLVPVRELERWIESEAHLPLEAE